MNELEETINAIQNAIRRAECADAGGAIIHKADLNKMLSLLKTQEPREPIRSPNYNYSYWGCNCSRCGHTLRDGEDRPNYCQECGQAVKWDG